MHNLELNFLGHLVRSRAARREAPHCVALLVHLVRHRGHLDDFAISPNRGRFGFSLSTPPVRPHPSVRVRPWSDPFTGCSHAARLLSLLAAPRRGGLAKMRSLAPSTPFPSLPPSSPSCSSPPLAPSLPSSSVYGKGRWRTGDWRGWSGKMLCSF